MTDTTLQDYNLIHWRCHRGMLELDLILVPFFTQWFLKLDASMQQAFIQLLEKDDHDIQSWLFKQQQPLEPALAKLIHLIREKTIKINKL